MSQIDVEYFCHRAATERAMAAAATHFMAIAAHLEMARRYEALVGNDEPLLVGTASATRFAVAA